MHPICRLIAGLFVVIAVLCPPLCRAEVIEALHAPYIFHSVNVITGSYVESATDLSLGAPKPLILRRCYQSQTSADSQSPIGWVTTIPSLFYKSSSGDAGATAGDGGEFDAEGRAVGVHTFLYERGGPCRWMNFRYANQGKLLLCDVVADDKTTLSYRYQVDTGNRGQPAVYLLSVDKDGEPLVSYEYKDHPLARSRLLVKRSEPNGGYLIAEYYDQKVNDVGGSLVTLDDPSVDKRWGRVKLLKGPAGDGAEPVITHRFFYGKNYTDVRDALNHRIIYRYGDFQRLTAIEYYDEQGALVRAERFEWRLDLLQPLMSVRRIEDAAGRSISCRRFYYDDGGQLVKETIEGELTGNGGKGEACTTTYQYAKGRLVSKTEGDHLCVSFHYDDQGRVACEHQVIDGSLHQRTFHTYDSSGLLVKTLIDNGCGPEQWGPGGEQKKLRRITPSKEPVAYGQPVAVEDLYYDPAAATYRSLEKVSYTYDRRGKVSKTLWADGDGQPVREVQTAYDAAGRPVIESESSGAVKETSYDANGNVSTSTEYRPDGSVAAARYTYDLQNRLVAAEISNHRGEASVKRIRYDAAGLKVSESEDGRGTTTYRYDALGRLVEMRQPPVVDEGGNVAAPVTTYRYDVCDNITSTTDPNGWTTRARYNARGKPLEITYPDGTKEAFRYNLAGMLVKETARTGESIAYARDGLGRCTKTVSKGSDGTLISTVTTVYGAFALIEESDSSGMRRICRYDGASRLVELIEKGGGLSKRTTYAYDARGRIVRRACAFPEGELTETVEYSDDGEVSAVVSQAVDGGVDRHPIEKGKATTVSSRFGYTFDVYGQEVCFAEETDSRGRVTATVYDVLGRVSCLVRKDSLGSILSQVEYRYDAAGNKTREEHMAGEGKAPFVLAWTYGIGNRLESLTEGLGSSEQRTTAHAYDQWGRLTQVIKPDGMALRTKYHPSGAIAELSSSDGTIHYRYEYDSAGNPVAAIDMLTGASTDRRYAAGKLLVEERLSNGLTLTYDHDKAGRRTRMSLPDGTGTAYAYKGLSLASVQRLNAHQEPLYTHTYLRYEQGKPAESSLICGLGVLSVGYGTQGQTLSVKSSYWSETREIDDCGRAVCSRIEDIAGAFDAFFSYGEDDTLISADGEAYGYDLLGNSGEGRHDGQNGLLAAGSMSFCYDANGNLIAAEGDGRSLRYVYDALNRLTAVEEEGVTIASYAYDPFNRRISKTTAAGMERYLYDGMCEIGAATDSGVIAQLRILGGVDGAEGGAAVAIELEGEVYAPIHDARGNVAALVSAAAREVAESYRYTAFGRMSIAGGGEESALGMPWGFSGKRIDPETGWVFFGLRHYDPAMRRWTTPDPLGYMDGPNRYAFVHNNPVINRDLYGEFTVGEAYHSCLHLTRDGIDFLCHAVSAFREKFSYANYSRHEVEEFANVVVGSLFLRLTGFYIHHPEVGVVGKGEISDKVRITMINGILNIRSEYMETVSLFSRTHGGANIHYVFRPSDGWAHDLIQCAYAKAGGTSSQARLLARTWKKLIREMGGIEGGGVIIHYAHSIGGTETKNAKRFLTPEERKMIRVVTIGSATLIPEGDFQSAVNYVSWRDGVCYFDPAGYARALLNRDTNIYLVGTRWGFPLVDHLLEGCSYVSVIELLGARFVETYGSLL